MAPINSKIQMVVSTSTCMPRNSKVWPTWPGAALKTVSKSIESKMKNVAKMPSEKPKSPIRFTMNALIAAAQADGRVYQKPINKYEARPTPSQPKNICNRLSDVTSINMAKVNSDR